MKGKQMVYRGGKSIFSGARKVKLPWKWIIIAVLIMVFGNWVLSKIPVIGDLLKGLRDFIKGGNQGQAAAVYGSESSIEDLKRRLKDKGISITGAHEEVANQIFWKMNEMRYFTNIWSREISPQSAYDIATIIFDNCPDYTSVACVIAAYGVRSCNNRQSAWAGFIWDETSGTLPTHISRYFPSDAVIDEEVPNAANRIKSAALEWCEDGFASV